MTTQKGNEEKFRVLYKNNSTKDVARILGIHCTTVNRRAKKLGIKHSDEMLNKEKRKKIELFKIRMRGNEVSNKRVNTWKRHRRMDEILFMSGMKTKTKFRMKVYPTKLYHAMWYLCKKYGYEFSDMDKYSLVRPTPFDEKRLTKVEERYMNKLRIKFI